MNESRHLVFLDTETTGLEPVEEHRIIELACLEMKARVLTGEQCRWLLDPQREIDPGAVEIHGITNAALKGQLLFAEIAGALIEFVRGSILVMHNALFDLGFINAELERAGYPEPIESVCAGVIDTLTMARELHPGQSNKLDALCQRYKVDASAREAGHSALLDATLLAKVYLAMTSGQLDIAMHGNATDDGKLRHPGTNRKLGGERPRLLVCVPSPEEDQAHEKVLRDIEKQNGKPPAWRQ